MMGFTSCTEIEGASPPAGISHFIFSVFDDKQRLLHTFRSTAPGAPDAESFSLQKGLGNTALTEAAKTNEPISLDLSYGRGHRLFLHILPYERKRGKWRYACVQVVTESQPAAADAGYVYTEDFASLILVDNQGTIRAASQPEPGGLVSAPDSLMGMNMRDLFSEMACESICSKPANTCEPIQNCVFHCLDDSRCDTALIKLSAPDNYTLYGVYDVTPPQPTEIVSDVVDRERRRMGQDLHDSIGQLFTAISLLSRSLANRLGRMGSPDGRDASQISELADEASNQIRQISRGLMPSEIVHQGLSVSLQELARITTSSCGVDCAARIDHDLVFSDGAVETHLYRIAQEAVNNAVRHAGAQGIEIIVAEENGTVQMIVRDDGTWKEPVESLAGIGLKTMEYRASVIGGQLEVDGCSINGTQVICRLEADESMMTIA